VESAEKTNENGCKSREELIVWTYGNQNMPQTRAALTSAQCPWSPATNTTPCRHQPAQKSPPVGEVGPELVGSFWHENKLAARKDRNGCDAIGHCARPAIDIVFCTDYLPER